MGFNQTSFYKYPDLSTIADVLLRRIELILNSLPLNNYINIKLCNTETIWLNFNDDLVTIEEPTMVNCHRLSLNSLLTEGFL